jgi:hypothetical protein
MNKWILLCIFLLISFVFSIGIINASMPASNDVYREKVFLHLGRNMVISGEPIWFKAYCVDASNNKPIVRSKVLYVELIDHNKKHILGQVLEIVNGCSSSSIDIPDTLSSGTYEIKAYTNWMRNFDPKYFYSSTVYIQNPFYDLSLKNFDYSNDKDIKVYVEGGMIIDELSNKLAIKLPYVPKERTTGKIIDENNLPIDSFVFDAKGLAVFNLLPAEGKSYRCQLSGGYFNDHQISIPHASISGYLISLNTINNNDIKLNIASSHTSSENIKIEVYCDEIKLKEIPLPGFNKNTSIEFSKESCSKGLVKILLKNSRGKVLAYNFFNSEQYTSPIKVNSLGSNYKTRSKIEFSLGLSDSLLDTSGIFSISVAKLSPFYSEVDYSDIGSYLLLSSQMQSWVNYKDEYGIIHFLIEQHNETSNYESYFEATDRNISQFDYPVENMGNLFQGKCYSPRTNLPVSKVRVLIAVIDTVPLVQSSVSDSDGNFAFLLKTPGAKNVFIQAYKNDSLINNEIKITLNNKYYYSDKVESVVPGSYPVNDSLFLKFLMEETKRVEIERAFETRSTQPGISGINTNKSFAFYGTPDFRIKLDDYFFLNNFQEITNSIIPCTRYTKRRKGCEISIFNSDSKLSYDDPVTLVDGIPVSNLCLLYSLNSDDIDRIEVQNHERIAGNMVYKGLISVFLKGDQRKVHNLLAPENKLLLLDGYYQSEGFKTIHFTGADLSDKRPYFVNQLYWDPTLRIGAKSNKKIEFYTSDEEGKFLLDIQGIDSKGNPLHVQKTFLIGNQ